MKVGIFTFQRAHNYGAVLQAYALKTTLEELGHEVKIIDYWPQYREKMYKRIDLSFLRNRRMGIKERIKTFLLAFQKYRRYNRFDNFIKHYLGLNGEVLYRNPDSIVNDCDIYVYGSDQIWRFNSYFKSHIGFDPVYWGVYPSSEAKKITYAASMGVMEMDDVKLEFIQRHLGNFSAVSVREAKLAEIIRPIAHFSVYHVLDPVFLLTEEKWKTIVKRDRSDEVGGRYILFYHLLYSEEAIALVKSLSKKTGLKIVEINGGQKPMVFENGGKLSDGPLEFVSLLAKAEFVVSTSFHGVVFSIVFKKQFYALGMGNNSSRVQSLLNALNIGDRLVDNGFEEIDGKESIDFNSVDLALSKYREDSLRFLHENCRIN